MQSRLVAFILAVQSALAAVPDSLSYLDGEESWRTEAKKARGTCQVPLYMKISAEAGGWTEFLPLPETLPDCMMADHVRVYSIMTAENGQE